MAPNSIAAAQDCGARLGLYGGRAERGIQRIALGDRDRAGLQLRTKTVELVGRERLSDDPADLDEVLLLEASGGEGRRPDPQAARDGGRTRIERDRVAVDRDPHRGQP